MCDRKEEPDLGCTKSFMAPIPWGDWLNTLLALLLVSVAAWYTHQTNQV